MSLSSVFISRRMLPLRRKEDSCRTNSLPECFQSFAEFPRPMPGAKRFAWSFGNPFDLVEARRLPRARTTARWPLANIVCICRVPAPAVSRSRRRPPVQGRPIAKSGVPTKKYCVKISGIGLESDHAAAVSGKLAGQRVGQAVAAKETSGRDGSRRTARLPRRYRVSGKKCCDPARNHRRYGCIRRESP